jgi:hypothetical protein
MMVSEIGFPLILMGGRRSRGLDLNCSGAEFGDWSLGLKNSTLDHECLGPESNECGLQSISRDQGFGQSSPDSNDFGQDSGKLRVGFSRC